MYTRKRTRTLNNWIESSIKVLWLEAGALVYYTSRYQSTQLIVFLSINFHQASRLVPN